MEYHTLPNWRDKLEYYSVLTLVSNYRYIAAWTSLTLSISANLDSADAIASGTGVVPVYSLPSLCIPSVGILLSVNGLECPNRPVIAACFQTTPFRVNDAVYFEYDGGDYIGKLAVVDSTIVMKGIEHKCDIMIYDISSL